MGEKIVSIIIISYLRFILVSVRVECSILIARFLMHILFESCFPILQSVKATIRHYSYYSLFATIRCSLFATIRYSLFGFSRHPSETAQKRGRKLKEFVYERIRLNLPMSSWLGRYVKVRRVTKNVCISFIRRG